MDIAQASGFLNDHYQGVFITLGGSGWPQATNIVYAYADGVARISVPSTTAKVRNLRRDDRASLHVTTADFGWFVVAEGRAELSAPSTEPGDQMGRALLDVYETIRKEPHPDHDEFFEVMARDQRLVIRLHIERVYGRVPG